MLLTSITCLIGCACTLTDGHERNRDDTEQSVFHLAYGIGHHVLLGGAGVCILDCVHVGSGGENGVNRTLSVLLNVGLRNGGLHHIFARRRCVDSHMGLPGDR